MNQGESDKETPMASWPTAGSGMPARAPTQEDLGRRVAAWRAQMPNYECSCHPRGAMVVVVSLLLGVTYVAMVIANNDHSAPSIVCMVVFHILFLLVVASYVQIVLISPGVVPIWWCEAISEIDPENYAICRRSNRHKPPRSHFDSVTHRLVLNMDHFCPWVANTVGFYNRKFFVLFVTYTFVGSLFVVICLLSIYHHQVFPFFDFSSPNAPTLSPSPGVTPVPAEASGSSQTTAQRVMMRIALPINGLFALLLGFFSWFHIRMALRNETSIENAEIAQKYDVGQRSNWCQVFGSNPWYWFLPVWGDGPDGNGIDWPMAVENTSRVYSDRRMDNMV